jgi:hypothetical protein
VALSRRLLLAGSGAGTFVLPACVGSGGSWVATGASTIRANVASTITGNAVTITVAAVPQADGTRPAAAYNALWTRDHAYALWHEPTLFTASQRRQWVTYYLSRRTTGVESDPDGGTLPPDFIADRIDTSGTATYKNAGASELPFMDGIAFVILGLWADWNLTGDATTFTSNQAAIDACLAAIPRSANGCVYSDPSAPSVDYGFCDTILKTGDVAYGTALQAWAYRMCDDMDPGGSSTVESDTYDNLASHARSGLATLRQSSGWYMGSSGNNAGVDDVWVTALAVAEGLINNATHCRASAQLIADTYAAGSVDGTGAWVSDITQYGLVRHLPVGQFWSGTSTTAGTYQNGGYWPTPVWDCVRAVDVVDPTLARQWVDDLVQQFNDEHTAEGTWANVPYEWHNYLVGVGAKGYTPHAAMVNRFV